MTVAALPLLSSVHNRRNCSKRWPNDTLLFISDQTYSELEGQLLLQYAEQFSVAAIGLNECSVDMRYQLPNMNYRVGMIKSPSSNQIIRMIGVPPSTLPWLKRRATRASAQSYRSKVC